MEKISEIINGLYQKYLPIVKKLGITLDIDFPDTTLTFREKDRVARDLDKTLRQSVSRAKNGRISISVRPGKIVVSDNGTILSPAACKLLTTEHIKVKSRVGFGTSVEISG